MSDRNNLNIDQPNSALENLDIEKLKSVFLRSTPVIILFLIISLSLAAIALRYTKQLFESSSTLQLDIKSDAKVLGFKNFDEDINILARETEIIKSKLFLAKVAETLNYNVSYFQYGDVLFEERYRNAPFQVNLISSASYMFNRPVDVDILNNNEYRLKYEIGEKKIDIVNQFKDTLSLEEISLVVNQTTEFNPSIDNRYFFTLNTNHAIVNYLNSNLTVQPLDFKAKTISISFKDHNRHKAHDIVHAIDTLYIYYTQQEKNKANTQKINFLNQQLGQTEDKLTELENYFENFTIDNKTTDLDKNLSKTIIQLEQLDSQQFEVQQRIKALNNAYEDIVKGDELEFYSTGLNNFPSNLRQELERLDLLIQERQVLLSSYNKNTLAFQKKEKEITILKEKVLKAIETSRQSQYENLDEIKRRRRNLETEFLELPSKRTEYTKTERYYGLYEEFYLSLMKNKAEFELAQAGTVTEYKILSPASTPSAPISPNKFIYYGIGIMAGLFLSTLFVLIRYLMHNKITSQQELERLSSAFVLGTIPFYSKENKTNSRLIVNKHLKSELSEAFRTIRTNLEFLNSHDDVPIIAITSTISGEGKTFVAANLGGIISLLNNRVILIDLDMRKPRFHEVFDNADSSKGLSTILINKHEIHDCIHHTSIENLDYIPAGPIPPNPSELILGGQFENIMSTLKKDYDVIIIDTPPVGLVTDGIQALKIASIPIYVVRADFSKKAFLKNVSRLAKVHKLKNLSLVLNSLKGSKNGNYGYGKGYYEEKPVQKKSKIKQIFQS